jgi:2-oxoglutarate ferredoxin oxidoreductase subunit alpha
MYLNPFPKNLGKILGNYPKILVPEINNGQLVRLLRAKYLIPAIGFNVVKGLPLRAEEIENTINDILGGNNG